MGDTNATKPEPCCRRSSRERRSRHPPGAVPEGTGGETPATVSPRLAASRMNVTVKQGNKRLNVSEKQSFHHVKKRSLFYVNTPPLWCDQGFVPNSRGNKAAANLRPNTVSFYGNNSGIVHLQHSRSSLSVPRDNFSIHEYINHLCRMLFPGGRTTSLAALAHSLFGKPLVGENDETHPWAFSANERRIRPGLNRQTIAVKGHGGRVENLGFAGCVLGITHGTTLQYWKRSQLDNLEI